MAEADYIAFGYCYAQILWMKQSLEDLGLHFKKVHMYSANTKAISLSKNMIQHLKAKHITVGSFC